ncbi:multicopper oxidase family protein [Georgenia faecalis]|uniref:Multicopper oxidase family protein n=1 Tax=Georgenia faecalis TaxID=2483799 RepID=A0ABV9D6D2_9MICO|nr:multicopper oxidase domain-containing protein [Georgenia faecalis]
MTRRSRLATAVAVTAATALLAACDGGFVGGGLPGVEEVPFTTPLAIPPLAPSRVEPDGTRVFELTAQEGSMPFVDGAETRTWGFNGDYLGPTLRAERGERVAVEVTNELGEATSVHWHGMHLPPEMDGGPHQMVEPGETWRPTWEIDQPAATLWYHPHPHGETERHVYQGLAGLFLLDDPEAAPDLPSQYGVDDIPVIVQDKQFDDAGQLTLEENQSEPGVLGQTVMVNGTVGPFLGVSTERVRLRLLNGSTARTYSFGFDDGRRFQLVGTDGGLLPAPHETTDVRLSPGERAEIVVAVTPGEQVTLRSSEPDLGRVASSAAFGGEDTFDVLELRADTMLAPSPPVPDVLADVPRIKESEAGVTRDFTLAVRQINGRSMDPERIDEVVHEGQTEIWEVRSIDSLPHNFHIHDVQFQVLDIGGEPPPPELMGWKDTVYLEPQRDYRLIMRFEDFTDADSPYMFHCHLLRHEDEGLMGQFVVVGEGESAPTTIDLDHDGGRPGADGGDGGADDGGGDDGDGGGAAGGADGGHAH